MTDADTDGGDGVPIPLIPPAPVETELSRLQDEWMRVHADGDREGAALILAQAALEYIEQATGSVGDGLGGGIIPLVGKAPHDKTSDWYRKGVGGLGDAGVNGPHVFETFRQAGLNGANGIGVVCSGIVVIDIDNWEAVPPAMWEILGTGLMASSRRNPEDRHAHIGWRVGADDYSHTLSGFDDLGKTEETPDWTAAGVGELRSSSGHIRIWSGVIGEDGEQVAARDPQWFVGLPAAPEELLNRLVVRKSAGGLGSEGELYDQDLWDWLDQHSLELVEDRCGVGRSERNLERQLGYFHEALDEGGIPKYSAALRFSLKLAADVAGGAIGGRDAYEGLLENYRQVGLAGSDWDERSRVSAYRRMWKNAIAKILDGRYDSMVQHVTSTVGDPFAVWRRGEVRKEWDPDTGEILDGADGAGGAISPGDNARGEGDPKPASRLDPSQDTSSPLASHEPGVQIGRTVPMSAEQVDEVVRRLMPVAEDGFMPSEQLLGDDFWEARGVLDFIRRWAWVRDGWPDAVLMGLLAGLGAALPLELVIDPTRSTPGPLSLFVLGIDQSGAGKSRNQTLAMRLLRELTGDFGSLALGRVIDLPIGTAEGILAKFFQKRDATELAEEKGRIRDAVAAMDSLDDEERAEVEKQALADLEKYIRRLDGVIVMADESKNLIEMDSLGGVGFATMLLSAWSGKGNILPTYKNSSDLPQFKPLSYRLSMNAAIQTGLAHKLLGADQVDSGFAQRLLLFPLNNNWTAYRTWQEKLIAEWRATGREVHPNPEVAGALVVEEQKDWIDLELAGGGGDRAWNMPDWTMVKGLRTTTDLEVGETWTMEIAEDCGYREAKLADARVRFEERVGDPMDAHMLFNQLRVAALLAVLDAGWRGSGRDDVTIRAEDWRLAGKISDCTRANRSWLIRVAEVAERRVQSELAKAQAIRESELVLHEDELSEEGFNNDLLQHFRRFHDPEQAKYKGDTCKSSCWYYAGQSQKRKERLKFWRSKGYFQLASESSSESEDEPAWFPANKIPGVVRIRYEVQGGGWPVAAAVWYTQMPVTGGDTGIVVHPEDAVES